MEAFIMAEQFDLIGKGRTLKTATILQGYGFLNALDKSYFCHIEDLDESLKTLIKQDKGNRSIPDYLPKIQFQSTQTKKGIKACNVGVHPEFHSALVCVVYEENTPNTKVCIPGFKGNCIQIRGTSSAQHGVGFFRAEISRAIPTNGSITNASSYRFCRLTSRYEWDAVTLDNLEDVDQDDNMIDLLSTWKSEHVKKELLKRAQSLTPENAGDQLNSLLELPPALQTLTRIESVLKQKTLAGLHQHRTQFEQGVFFSLLQVLDINSAAVEAKALLEAAFDKHAAVIAIDLESDGTTIKELGISNGSITSQYDEQGRINAFIDQAKKNAQSQLWIGHNIKKWDAPILAEYGLELSNKNTWDTLYIEALLSPRRVSLALDTPHRAGEDAAHTYRLFRNQILRLLLGGHALRSKQSESIIRPIWQKLKGITPALKVIASNRSLRESIARQYWRESDDFFISKKSISLPKHISDLIEASRLSEGITHIVYPRLLGPALYSIPGAYFFDQQHADLNLVIYPGDENDLSYMNLLASAYSLQCQKDEVTPLYVNMPVWSRTLLQTKLGSFCKTTSSPKGNQKLYFSPADFYLRAPVNEPARLLWVEPEANSSLPGFVVRTLSKIELELFLEQSADPWGWLRTRKDIWQVKEEQAAAMLANTDYAPLDGCTYWIRRVRFDQYELIEKALDWEKSINTRWSGQVKRKSVPFLENDTPELTYVKIKKPIVEGAHLHLMRLNPETPYRSVYWAMQTLILDDLQKQFAARPVVLLVSDRDAIPKLEDLLIAVGCYIPRGSLYRRLELIAQKRKSKPILVCSLDQLTSVLEANAGLAIELTFVIESLPLQTIYAMASGGEDVSTEDTDSDGVSDDDDDSFEETNENGPPTIRTRFSLSKALQHIAQLLKLQLRLIVANLETHHVVILDPRVERSAVDEAFPLLRELEIPAFDKPYFDSRQRIVHEYFPSAKYEEATLPTDWLQLLEQIFLGGKGENGQPGKFRDEQVDYLDKIIHRKEDVLVEMPTGGGKSILFQAPAIYHGMMSNLASIVVTPLKALMADQVESLHALGFYMEVDFISGDLVSFEKNDIYRRLAGGELKMIYVAPERYRSRGFIAALEKRIENDHGLAYNIFDEAHCISLWGLDFRPDYRVPVKVHKAYWSQFTKNPVIMLSATITEQVYQDLELQLL